MQSGKTQPFISIRSVRDALDSMLYGAKSTSPVSNPLLYLLLIEVRLLNPDLPDTQIAREHTLNHYLANCITEQYVHVRQSNSLDFSTQESLATVHSRIISERGFPELLAWSWLYHHYVRVDLAIHAEMFCSLADLNERTLRRYQQHGIRRLTARIVDDERAARRDNRQRRLLNVVAAHIPQELLGER
ncbi:MAG: hypothetical protein JNJ61_07835 [Anaerolineae bacterium]|nr:hypothetical protein [Anaerolineae bacterium]